MSKLKFKKIKKQSNKYHTKRKHTRQNSESIS